MRIEVLQSASGVRARVTVDGVEQPGDTIAMVDDGQEHSVTVSRPAAAAPPSSLEWA